MCNRWMRWAAAGCMALTLVLASGCLNTVFVAGPEGYVDTKRSGKGIPFQIKIKNTFGFFGTRPSIRIFEVDRVVSKELGREVKHITGLKITQHLTVVDWLLQSLTFGFYNPRTLVIEGEIQETPPPGAPSASAEEALAIRAAPAAP